MRTLLHLTPGQKGTKQLLAQYGDRLVCVRYRYDAKRQLRLKTVELIVETTRWNPRARNARRRPEDIVVVRIAYSESELRERVKRLGGIWRPQHRLWELDWRSVCNMGLQDRVVTETGETSI